MNVIAGNPAALTFRFKIGEEPVSPDIGTVTYSVLDQAGLPVAGLIDVAVSTTTTTFQTTVLIPALAHAIGAGRRFERRMVIVNYKVGGRDVLVRQNYRVIPDLSHTVTEEHVRAFIGIEAHELPDDDIDLFAAYLAVEENVGVTDLAAALVSGSVMEIFANDLICLKAVLNVLPSAKQRMAQSEKNGVKEFSRVDLKELDKLGVEALRRYEEALGKLVVITEVSPSLLLTTDGTDAITG